MKNLRISIALLALLGIAITACKKENVQPNSSSSDAGSFKVRMTDAPGDYEGLFVEIASVDAYLEGKGWVNLNSEMQTVSVLDLTNGAETNLAFRNEVEAGVYSQLKIEFGTNNKLKLNSQSRVGLALGDNMSANGMIDLDVEAGTAMTRTVIIEIDETVSAASGANVLIDFNVAASIIEDESGFILKPTLLNIEDEFTGVSGQVKGAVQSSIQIESPTFETSTNADSEGNFLLRGMPSGTYTLIIDAEVEGQEQNAIRILQDVRVNEGRIESVGSIDVKS